MVRQWNKDQTIDNYFKLKFAPYRSFDMSSECGKNVNLRLGQYCRCTHDGTLLTWSSKARNWINVESFVLQAMFNWL